MEESIRHDEFTMRDEVFFITYMDVIKSPYPIMLKRIMESTALKKALEPMAHLEALTPFTTLSSFETLMFQRKEYLLFDYLKKHEDVDVLRLEQEMNLRYNDLFEASTLLAIGESVKMMVLESFVKQVYIYTDVYDPRIHADIQVTYEKNPKVTYVTGEDLPALLDTLPHKPTGFFINNIDHIIDLASKPEYLDFTHLFVADYLFNLIRTDEGEIDYRFELEPYLEERITRFSTFKPMEFLPAHVAEFDDIMKDDDGFSFKLVKE